MNAAAAHVRSVDVFLVAWIIFAGLVVRWNERHVRKTRRERQSFA